MQETTATKLLQNFSKEIASCFDNHDGLYVKQQDGRGFVIHSAKDWQAIEETLFLNQIPNMVSSIHDAANEELKQGVHLADLEW